MRRTKGEGRRAGEGREKGRMEARKTSAGGKSVCIVGRKELTRTREGGERE
jgi:hypothetical protein